MALCCHADQARADFWRYKILFAFTSNCIWGSTNEASQKHWQEEGGFIFEVLLLLSLLLRGPSCGTLSASDQDSSNCKGRCWHQTSPAWSQSEKTRQSLKGRFPSQWLLGWTAGWTHEQQGQQGGISHHYTGERAITSFIKSRALSHFTTYLTFPKQRIECLGDKSNPTINCNECEWIDH